MAVRKGVGRKGEKGGKGIKMHKLPFIKSHRDVKFSTENTVSNIVITMYATRWVLDLLGLSTS